MCQVYKDLYFFLVREFELRYLLPQRAVVMKFIEVIIIAVESALSP